jgi:ADP-heptose:LPS heptosyltransferase
MNVLILKLNATGDVVRTTTLLHRLQGDITWITAPTTFSSSRV